MPANVNTICLKDNMLTGVNENWRSYHQEVADFCMPEKAWINSIRITGDRLKFNFLYDTTAMRSLNIATAGFHSNMTNPSTKWFGLLPDNLQLRQDRDVKMFFEECRDVQLGSFNQSNFDNVQQEFYKSFLGFGTGCTLQMEDFKTKCRFTSIPVSQLNLEEDAYGRVVAVYRTFKLKAIQAWDLWGAKAGKNVADAVAGEKYYQEFEFLHYAGPRHVYIEGKKDALNMPIESCWIEKKSKWLIAESGFMDLPYHTGRYSHSEGDSFGYSPAMFALASIKLLNAQKRTTLRGAMKATDPAVQVPSRGYVLPLNFNPAAINYRMEGTNHDAIQPMPTGNGNFQVSLEMMQMERSDIEEFFFVPLFKALSQVNKQMTVPEVQQRINEYMILAGPAVSRASNEYLDPLVIRNFNINLENNQFPEIPEVLRGATFRPVYLGPLAKAQRESELGTINKFLGAAMQIGQFKPTALDRIDEDKTIDAIADITGVTPKILRSDRDMAMLRQQREQAQQAAQQMQMFQVGGATAKDFASAGAQKAKAEQTAA